MALTFKQATEDAIKSMMGKVNDKCYEIAKECFRYTVKLSPSPQNNSPWSTGLLANQWYPKNGPTFSTEVSSSTSPSGGASLLRIEALNKTGASFYRIDGSVTLTNNVQHAYRAEYLGWLPPKWKGVSGPDRKGSPYRMVAQAIQITAANHR